MTTLVNVTAYRIISQQSRGTNIITLKEKEVLVSCNFNLPVNLPATNYITTYCRCV